MRNLEEKGITEKEAVMLLENDVQERIVDLQEIFQKTFEQLSRQTSELSQK